MNILTVLTPEEADALVRFHAERSHHVDEAEAARAWARIAQLRALLAPERIHDIQEIAT